jgi:nitrogen fixation NifU-like protein
VSLKNDIYNSILLSHSSEEGTNYGEIKNPDYFFSSLNRLCGDEVEFYLILKNNLIEKISYKAKGCAICKASASILASHLHSKKLTEAIFLLEHFIDSMKLENTVLDLSNELNSLLAIKTLPSRIRCVLLSWDLLQKELKIIQNQTKETI